MDLDTLIYIIAIIVIFVVSLLGQNKNKKKKNLPVEAAPDKVAYSLNDFEKILQRKEEFRQVHEIKKEEAQEEEHNEQVELKENEPFEQQTKSTKNNKQQELKDKRDFDEKEDGFDLNSAIIYSSILERKKFRH